MSRRSVIAAFAVAVGIIPITLVACAPSASAFVTSGGTGRGSAQVGTLDAPTDVTATVDGSTAGVTGRPS